MMTRSEVPDIKNPYDSISLTAEEIEEIKKIDLGLKINDLLIAFPFITKNDLLYLAFKRRDAEAILYFLEEGATIPPSAIPCPTQPQDAFSTILLQFSKHGAMPKDPEGETLLTWAAKEGRLPIIKILLAKGASIWQENGVGYTALELADMNFHIPVIASLLDHGCTPKDPEGSSLLLWSAKKGLYFVVEGLLAKNTTGWNENGVGFAALKLANAHDHRAVMKLLLRHGLQHAPDNSLLTWGTENKLFLVVKAFLEEKADIWNKNGAGFAALELAGGDTPIIKLLLKHSFVQGRDGKNLLVYSAEKGLLLVMDKLLGLIDKLFGNVIWNEQGTGFIVLKLANTNGHRPVVERLLSHAIQCGGRTQDDLLLHSAGEGLLLAVDALIGKKKSIWRRGGAGGQAWLLARDRGHEPVMDLLLRQRLDGGWKPDDPALLPWAAKCGYQRAVIALLEKMPSVWEKDGIGFTALREASEKGHKPIVELLMLNRLEGGWRTYYPTLLGWAAQGGYELLVTVLLEQMPDTWIVVGPVDGPGFSALRQANESGQGRIIELLINNWWSSTEQPTVSPLFFWAVEKGLKLVVQIFLRKRLFTMNTEDEDSILAAGLELAKKNNQNIIVRLLSPQNPETNPARPDPSKEDISQESIRQPDREISFLQEEVSSESKEELLKSSSRFEDLNQERFVQHEETGDLQRAAYFESKEEDRYTNNALLQNPLIKLKEKTVFGLQLEPAYLEYVHYNYLSLEGKAEETQGLGLLNYYHALVFPCNPEDLAVSPAALSVLDEKTRLQTEIRCREQLVFGKSLTSRDLLYMACRRGEVEHVTYLLEQIPLHALPLLMQTDNFSVLLFFRMHNNISGFRDKLEYDFGEDTLLTWAVRQCHPQLMLLLLEKGVDILQKNGRGKTALDLAFEFAFESGMRWDPTGDLTFEWGDSDRALLLMLLLEHIDEKVENQKTNLQRNDASLSLSSAGKGLEEFSHEIKQDTLDSLSAQDAAGRASPPDHISAQATSTLSSESTPQKPHTHPHSPSAPYLAPFAIGSHDCISPISMPPSESSRLRRFSFGSVSNFISNFATSRRNSANTSPEPQPSLAQSSAGQAGSPPHFWTMLQKRSLHTRSSSSPRIPSSDSTSQPSVPAEQPTSFSHGFWNSLRERARTHSSPNTSPPLNRWVDFSRRKKSSNASPEQNTFSGVMLQPSVQTRASSPPRADNTFQPRQAVLGGFWNDVRQAYANTHSASEAPNSDPEPSQCTERQPAIQLSTEQNPDQLPTLLPRQEGDTAAEAPPPQADTDGIGRP